MIAVTSAQSSVVRGRFTAHLLRLIAKADDFNRDRLRLSFPEEVAAYEEWINGPYITEDALL